MIVSALAQTKLLIAEQHLHSIIKFFYNSKLSYYNFFCPGSDMAEATGQAVVLSISDKATLLADVFMNTQPVCILDSLYNLYNGLSYMWYKFSSSCGI